MKLTTSSVTPSPCRVVCTEILMRSTSVTGFFQLIWSVTVLPLVQYDYKPSPTRTNPLNDAIFANSRYIDGFDLLYNIFWFWINETDDFELILLKNIIEMLFKKFFVYANSSKFSNYIFLLNSKNFRLEIYPPMCVHWSFHLFTYRSHRQLLFVVHRHDNDTMSIARRQWFMKFFCSTILLCLYIIFVTPLGRWIATFFVCNVRK